MAPVRWSAHPTIYEINTWVWLDQLSSRLRAPITLGTVPAAEWDRIAERAIDAVWLMGVWERSPIGTEVMRADHPGEEAVVGSPYCVHRYIPDDHLGGFTGLDAARRQLQGRGVGLLLDYVPNHVASDHPWVSEHPEYFVRSEGGEKGPFALGRELPTSPPWSDVVQLNALHPGNRAAGIATLETIAEHCDGVRCDMAMLALNDVFARCWGERAGPVPNVEYWSELIGATRARREGFVFVAEAYWDCEWRLMQLGFDFCYDKVLCDRLVRGDGPSIRAHLGADHGFQRRLVRFTENHDENRAAAVMAPRRNRAAALALATLPGATLFYEGQFEGRTTRLPVVLGRRPPEPADTALEAFYQVLLPIARELRDGAWRLCEVTGWPDNDSCRHIVAWSWQTPGATFLVAINFSGAPAEGRVYFPIPERRRHPWSLTDLLTQATYEREPDELAERGLYVGLPEWGCHLLKGATQEPL